MSFVCRRTQEKVNQQLKSQEKPVEEEGEKGASVQGSCQGMAAVLLCQRNSSTLPLRPSQAFPARAINPVLVSPAILWSLKEGNGKKQERISGELQSLHLLWEVVLESGGSQWRWDGFRSVCVLTMLEQMTGVRGCCSKSLIYVGNGVAISD